MSWRAYDGLPVDMQNDITKFYYDILSKKRVQLIIKRCLDVIISAVLLIILAPIMAVIAIFIIADSKGAVIFKQVRVKQYMEEFLIYKFRTMRIDSEDIGVTRGRDNRITKVGELLRRLRLDELPQLYNILKGDMSFVGARPEIPKFTAYYDEKMRATLLMPVGLTCMASIKFKNEAELLTGKDYETVYIRQILPDKMQYNIEYIEDFSLIEDTRVLIKTLITIFKE